MKDSCAVTSDPDGSDPVLNPVQQSRSIWRDRYCVLLSVFHTESPVRGDQKVEINRVCFISSEKTDFLKRMWQKQTNKQTKTQEAVVQKKILNTLDALSENSYGHIL